MLKAIAALAADFAVAACSQAPKPDAAIAPPGSAFYVERIGDGPIISPATDPSIGHNIQGPSLIRVITPTQIKRDRHDVMRQTSVLEDSDRPTPKAYLEPETLSLAADPVMKYMTADQLENNCQVLETDMRRASKEQDFISAAQLRDELFAMRKLLEERLKASNTP